MPLLVVSTTETQFRGGIYSCRLLWLYLFIYLNSLLNLFRVYMKIR